MKFEKFEFIKEKYGPVASWAIWKEVGETPKSNAGDLNILDPKINKNLLSQLRPNVVLVGLNLSRNDGERIPFANFHSSNSYATDFKIRFALSDTKLWGGYMTDIIKEHEELHSQSVVRYLKKNPNVEKQNIEIFLEELKDLGTENRTIIAFGEEVYPILKRNLQNEFNIFKVTHYSAYINEQELRDAIKSLIKNMKKLNLL